MLRMHLILLLMAVSTLTQAQAQAPALEAGPVVRVPHYEQVIDLTLGGDGHYYVTMTASGSTEQFSGHGESVVTVRRFDAGLIMTDEVAFGKGRGPDKVNNVYAVLPHPEGIALLTLMRSEKGMMSWHLCHPRFEEEGSQCECDSIFPMPGHNPTMTNPYFRTKFDAKGNVAVAWRSLDQPQDNSLQVMVLDRDLEPLHPPAAPFLKWTEPINLGPWSMVDADRLIFQIEGEGKRGGRRAPQGGGTGLVYHDFAGEFTQDFAIGSSLTVPLTVAAALHPQTGEMVLAGFCGEWFEETLYLGMYAGTYTGGDTMEILRRWNVSQATQEYLTFEKGTETGAFYFRRPMQQSLTFAHGRNQKGMEPFLWSSFLGAMEGKRDSKNKNATQHTLWGHPLGENATGQPMVGDFQNCQFEEFRNSWGFGLGQEGGMVVDFSKLKNPMKPYGYKIVQFMPQVTDSGNGFLIREIPQNISMKGKSFTLLQPRFSSKEEEPVVVSRFRNNLRLVRFSSVNQEEY